MKAVLAILADVANGLFAVLVASHVTEIDLVWWHFLVGIAFAMCPDVDALPELFKRGMVAASSKHNHDHRETLHFPILFVIAGVVLMQINPVYGTVFLVATMLHFVNDLYGTGWGVSYFWPITRRRYKLFSRRANLLKSILIEKDLWSGLSYEDKRLHLVVSWSYEELSKYIKKYGIEDWIERYYLQLNWISGIEYTVFAIAVILAIATVF
jgi:hypothetical protein